MVTVKLTLIYISVYSVITIRKSFDIDVSDPNLSPSKSLLDEEDTNGAQTNLDIHLAMKSGNTLPNLKSIIREENELLLRDFSKQRINATTDNAQIKGPVVVRSTTAETSIDLESLCLKQKNILGVHYNSCSKILKNQSHYPRNCKEVQQNGHNVTGVYDIYPRYSVAPISVLCDMQTKGGGWTHIQKRFDGSQDFVLEWIDYKFGFGDLEGEFWLGLQNIYLLSAFELTELLVEVVDRDNASAHAQYSSFAIGPESQGYTLERLSGFSGDAGDSLTYHLGQKFCTKDLDFTTQNCATAYNGGWWYKDCHICNLNGKYSNIDLPEKYKFKGIHWKTFRSHEYCHSKSRMLIRPVK